MGTGRGFSPMCGMPVENVPLNFGSEDKDSGSQHVLKCCALNSSFTFWHGVEKWLEQCLHKDLQQMQFCRCGYML